jgi:hypothetical protein
MERSFVFITGRTEVWQDMVAIAKSTKATPIYLRVIGPMDFNCIVTFKVYKLEKFLANLNTIDVHVFQESMRIGDKFGDRVLDANDKQALLNRGKGDQDD